MKFSRIPKRRNHPSIDGSSRKSGIKASRRTMDKPQKKWICLNCDTSFENLKNVHNVVCVISRDRKGETKPLNAGSGTEVIIPELPMGCSFGQFLVWVMYRTKDMLPVAQFKFLHDKFGMRFGSSIEFMNWLINEASGLEEEAEMDILDKLRAGEDVQTHIFTEPPMGCSFKEFLEWVTYAIKGMGSTAKKEFVRKKFPGVPESRRLLFPRWVIDVTKGMDCKPRRMFVDSLRAGEVVSIPNRKKTDAPMGCSFIDFLNWLGPAFVRGDDEAREEIYAVKLPGFPKKFRHFSYTRFLMWFMDVNEGKGDLGLRAFADRLRVGPEFEINTVGMLVLEPVHLIRELPRDCSCKEFLKWCRGLGPEALEAFIEEKVPGKPKGFTPRQFLEWATRETEGMGNGARREFVNRIRVGPELEPHNLVITRNSLSILIQIKFTVTVSVVGMM